jgi:hypothetical protein
MGKPEENDLVEPDIEAFDEDSSAAGDEALDGDQISPYIEPDGGQDPEAGS